MGNGRVTDDNPIPFLQEVWRKTTHIVALVIPGGYWLLGLTRIEMLAVMVPVFAFMITLDIARLRERGLWRNLAKRIWGPMVRSHEASDFTGATYILLSVCCTVALFDRAVAVAALSYIIVGDTFAALIGRKFGRHRFGRKSVEGSLGCLFGTLAVAALTPGLPWWVAAAGAVVATVTEALSVSIDDNISVPLVSGLVMTLLLSISSVT